MASQHPETEARSSSGAKAAPCHWAKLDAIVMSPENAVPEGVWIADAVRLCVCVWGGPVATVFELAWLIVDCLMSVLCAQVLAHRHEPG